MTKRLVMYSSQFFPFRLSFGFLPKITFRLSFASASVQKFISLVFCLNLSEKNFLMTFYFAFTFAYALHHYQKPHIINSTLSKGTLFYSLLYFWPTIDSVIISIKLYMKGFFDSLLITNSCWIWKTTTNKLIEHKNNERESRE